MGLIKGVPPTIQLVAAAEKGASMPTLTLVKPHSPAS